MVRLTRDLLFGLLSLIGWLLIAKVAYFFLVGPIAKVDLRR